MEATHDCGLAIYVTNAGDYCYVMDDFGNAAKLQGHALTLACEAITENID